MDKQQCSVFSEYKYPVIEISEKEAIKEDKENSWKVFFLQCHIKGQQVYLCVNKTKKTILLIMHTSIKKLVVLLDFMTANNFDLICT